MSTPTNQNIDNTPMKKGKHKGKTPDELSEIDPQYLVWAYESWTDKPCTHAMYEYCKKEVDIADD